MILLLLLTALYAPHNPPATFSERWPDPFHEFGLLPYPAPFQSDGPELNTYALDSNGWISGRCAVKLHRTLCIWDEAGI